MTEPVAGYCPMGCGETLFLGSGGYITCSWIQCPNPTAVSDILGHRETEHLVLFEPGTFTILHPLRERTSFEGLLQCDLAQHIQNDLLPRITPKPGVNMARRAAIPPDSRLADAATWFFDEVARPRWPIAEVHTCTRCGDPYTGVWRDHLRLECSTVDHSEPAPDPEPEPLMAPDPRRARR